MTQRNESKLRQSVELPAAGTAPRSRKRKASRRPRNAAERGRRLKMESLESRRLLAVSGGLGFNVPVDPAIFAPQAPRNVGTVNAFNYNELEGNFNEGANDNIENAEVLPLGTGPQQQDTIDVFGTSSSGTGDFYAVDLRAGDILDISVNGGAGGFQVLYGNGAPWFSTTVNTGLGSYPDGSPLQTAGDAVGAQVIPEDGRYFIFTAASATPGAYTMGLRAYRPAIESAPLGAQQKVFLDFDGHVLPASDFPGGGFGFLTVFGLTESLQFLGYINPVTPDDVNQIIDYTVEETVNQLRTLGQDGSLGSGTNGDFLNTGIGGDYGITVLNSRDHADPGDSDPLLTRVVIGSTGTFPIGGIFGVAQSIDIGNFRPNEQVFVGLEPHWQTALGYFNNGQVSPALSIADAASQQMASTITHELGHSFGMWHTDGDNFVGSLSDEGSQSLNDFSQALGPDGVFGTDDDITPYFADDNFSSSRILGPGEDLFDGIERMPAALSHSLSTGTVGSVVSGNVYNDLNRDGRNVNEPGVAGVVVFADLLQNGQRDNFEPTAVSDGAGNYSLIVPPGIDINVLMESPAQFIPINPPPVNNSQGQVLAHRFATGGASGVDFGISQFQSDVTGVKFADLNGNGVFDSNEPTLEGVRIYVDLDGDDRIDTFEPQAVSGPDGRYTLNFPGAGTYTIREVIEPGFVQTFPGPSAGFEHQITFNGVAVRGRFQLREPSVT